MTTGDKRIRKRSQYANHHEPAVSHDNQYAKKPHWMTGMKDRKRNKKRRKRKYAQQRKSHQLTENGLDALKDDGLYYNEGIRDDRNKTKKEIGCCEQNWNKFDGRKIDKNNRNVCIQYFCKQLVDHLEGYLTPEKQDTWNIFCCRMESITSFPRSSFKNMESITDIMNLLKRKRDDNKILAYSCLMDSVRGMELSYPKHIDTIFNKIMDLDQQSKTHVKHAKRITVQWESTEVKMGDVGTHTINDNQKAINDCDEEQMTNRLAEHVSPAKYGRKSPYVHKKVFPPRQYERNRLDNVKQKASMGYCKCTWSLKPRHSDKDIRNRTVSMVTDVKSRISSYSFWPNRSIRTGPLVDGGFCCKDPHTTTVECTACGLVLDASTLNGKSPLDYHREHSSDCEFFYQTNSQNSDRQQTKPLTNSPNIPAAMGNNQGANAFPASSPTRNNHRSTDTSGRAQTENNQEAKGKPVRTPPGHSDGNISIDKDRRQTENASSLFANNGAASSEPLVAKRPKTGEVFDRTTLSVPNNNNNNVTSSGKGLRENGNTATVADILNVLKAPFFHTDFVEEERKMNKQMPNKQAYHLEPANHERLSRKSPCVHKKGLLRNHRYMTGHDLINTTQKKVTYQYFSNCLDNVKMKGNSGYGNITRMLIPRHINGDLRNHNVYIVKDVMSRISSYSFWPNRSIRTGPLVEGGFSCKDPHTTTVECTACGLVLDASTLNGRSPLDFHREHSPDCEFFHSGHLTDSPNIPAGPIGINQGANAFPASSPPGNNNRTTDTTGREQKENNREGKDNPARTPPGYNHGNIFIDDAPSDRRQTGHASSQFSNNGAASLEPHVAELPRTGEVFDRAALNVPNDNNVTSSGEALRENENPIAGAVGGDVPYPIRNPRYTEQNARRETYTHWPHRAAHDIDILVNAGFFYTGAEDIVRCYYCDIGLAEWNPNDDPWVEHARHSPECPYLRDQKGQDYINNIQTQWARIYTPKHPQHTQADARRRTFENAGWPRDNVLQAPEQLAAAGFFYTGEGDTVRCHYCDGGLREWEPQDDPWVEHARWFPFCKFVLKIKGIDFIQASATGNPGNGLHAPVAPAAAPRANEPPLTISFVDACRIKEQRNPMYSAAAQSTRTMGYSRVTIRMAINKFIALTGRRDFKSTDLMDIIMEMEDAGQELIESDGEDEDDDIGATASRAAAGGMNATDPDEEMELTPAAMRKENEYLKTKFKCKVCDQRERCIVFVPCGHRITCQHCGEQAVTCPHCNSRIDQRFKTYLG